MTEYYSHNGIAYYQGHVIDVWQALAAAGVRAQTVVTSIPYYGLRSYGTEPQTWPDGWRGELGQEPTPDLFVAHIVAVFRAVRAAMRPDATLFLNVGDTYTANRPYQVPDNKHRDVGNSRAMKAPPGMSEKQLLLMPARVALALQADGWILRNEIIWHKTAPMPESVQDRFTRAHEQIFVFSLRPRYFMDMDAIAEPAIHEGRIVKASGNGAKNAQGATDTNDRRTALGFTQHDTVVSSRNPRDVWTLGPDPYADAHFATFPTEIPRRAILAGTSARGACPACGAPWRRMVEQSASDWAARKAAGATGGTLTNGHNTTHGRGTDHTLGRRSVLAENWQPGCKCHAGDPVPCLVADPFLGSGTSAAVAYTLGRAFVGGDLNADYLDLAIKRLAGVTPWYARADGPAPDADFGPLFAGVA